VTGEPGPHPLCTEYQVKRTLTVTASDTDFVAVVGQALHTLHDRGDRVACGDLGLGLIARGEQRPLEQLTMLAEYARGHATHDTFGEVFQPGVVNQKVCARLTQVRNTVEAAFVQGAPDLGGVDRSTHALLSALHVWRVFDDDDGADYLAALDRL